MVFSPSTLLIASRNDRPPRAWIGALTHASGSEGSINDVMRLWMSSGREAKLSYTRADVNSRNPHSDPPGNRLPQGGPQGRQRWMIPGGDTGGESRFHGITTRQDPT